MKQTLPMLKSVLLATCSLFIFETVEAADPAEAKTIGRVVRERPDLSNFLKLLEKTEIGSQLSEKTSIRQTVFAPTDEAFDKLPKDSLKTLLDPRNDDRLEEVFGFHVLNRSLPAIGLETCASLQMATGQFLSIDYKGGKISGAGFIGEIIPCSNGTIYLIDRVLTPNTDDLFQTLQKDGRFTIFTKAITASRQGKLFQNMHGLYTTFAPTDEAFKKLPPAFIESLFQPENDERLEDIIKHHILEGIRAEGRIPGYLSLGVSDVTPSSAFGQQLNFKITAKGPSIDGASIIETDIPCANGIIHVIDSVISPVDSSLLDLLQADERFSTLVTMLEATGLDLPVASSSQFTIYAPVNEAWKKEPYASLVAEPTGKAREALYGILSRHVITGKHVSENCRPYNKLRTIHGAPIYLIREGDDRRINGIPIDETDKEAFNGLINAIGEVIEDPMELPEGDISTVDAIEFVQQTLTDAAPIYGKGEYEACWRFYTARGYEFLSKYSQFIDNNSNRSLSSAIRDDQPGFQFASDAWASRNAFRSILRTLEQREDRIQDSYLMKTPEKARFGR
ncbi:MAG: fasciclin domain-containing protein [Akkermansiaceae bacterium]